MSLKVGIVGLPNVGKSTLFKALTKTSVDINNYPFCTIAPNVGVVKVPDSRLLALSKMSQSEKMVPAVVEFVDIAGLVSGASKGEGLGNQFLSHIREVDVIAQVVRVFENEKITHVLNRVSPEEDLSVIETELILADLETVSKAVTRLEKDVRGNVKGAHEQLEIVLRVKSLLNHGEFAREVLNEISLGENDFVDVVLREMALLTMKPIFYVYNVADFDQELPLVLSQRPHVKLDIKIEEELSEMFEEEAKDLGMVSHINDLIVSAYELLGLQTFFTTGEKETRAWTISKGVTAPEAGAAIHSDFKERFIRADVVFWEDLLDVGSWNAAREQGVLKTVGKDYLVCDGDVMEFRI